MSKWIPKKWLATEFKRLLLRHVDTIAIFASICIVLAILLFLCSVLPYLEELLSRVALSRENPLVLAIIGALLASAILFLLKRFPDLKRSLFNRLRGYLFRNLVSVNNDIWDKHIEQLKAYSEVLAERIRKLIPEDLAEAWDNKIEGVPDTLIRPRAEEILTVRSESMRREIIIDAGQIIF